MYNHNKAQQSKNRVHIPWDILYLFILLNVLWYSPRPLQYVAVSFDQLSKVTLPTYCAYSYYHANHKSARFLSQIDTRSQMGMITNQHVTYA